MSQVTPVLYGLCFVLLLVQAMRLMARGLSATGSKKDRDRTSRKSVTIHPELLDQEGNLLEDELLTVRFTGGNEPPTTTSPGEQPDDPPPLAPR